MQKKVYPQSFKDEVLKKYFMTAKNVLAESRYITNYRSLATVYPKNVLHGLCKKWDWK